MTLLALVVVLVFVGVVLGLVPMDDRIKQLIVVIVILAVCVWLLGAFGVLDAGSFRLR